MGTRGGIYVTLMEMMADLNILGRGGTKQRGICKSRYGSRVWKAQPKRKNWPALSVASSTAYSLNIARGVTGTDQRT